MSQAANINMPGSGPAEILAQSLLRLPQLVKIHQPNNKLFVENLTLFQNTLKTLWADEGRIDIRVHRGRLYINKARLNFSPILQVTAVKLMEYFESRGLFGFSFDPKPDLTNEDIIDFIKKVNLSQNQPAPLDYLAEALSGNWAAPILDDNFKITFLFSEESGVMGRPLVWNSTPSSEANRARRTYSRALAELTKLNDNLSGSTGLVNFAKSRRVVQDMAESLFRNENILLSLSTIRDYDDYTCSHCVNVAILSMCLGRRLGLGKMELATLGLGGLFHDLGKVDIPIDLIRKPGKFTDLEYEEVKKHSLNSVCRIFRLNSDQSFKAKLLLPPFEHHLNLNLTGYPDSERRFPLSLFGRIVAITDLYDALTSSRSYRPVPISPDKALEIMIKKAPLEIDSLLLKVFINMVGIYPVGTLLLLDSRQVVMVSGTPAGAEAGRPQAYVLEKEDEMIKKGELIDLAEKNEDGQFVRNILHCFHSSEFGLFPSDVLL
ncbi:MAG: HD domain-containing protein [Deltaproteobacteria bacterium]|jgi:HD-GYP domain-containing protein (c-di-GMP phosphodiesterase class II)|nr:HD domain-containing protein [Deltaproteobacteria bacterium]